MCVTVTALTQEQFTMTLPSCVGSALEVARRVALVERSLPHEPCSCCQLSFGPGAGELQRRCPAPTLPRFSMLCSVTPLLATAAWCVWLRETGLHHPVVPVSLFL